MLFRVRGKKNPRTEINRSGDSQFIRKISRYTPGPREYITIFQGRSSDSRISLFSAPSHLTRRKTVAYADFVPGYSGGTVPDLHGVPF